jgi:Ribosome-binding factor A
MFNDIRQCPCEIWSFGTLNLEIYGQYKTRKNRTDVAKRAEQYVSRHCSQLSGCDDYRHQCADYPRLSIAKVYLSIFPGDKSESTLALIKGHAKTIRYELGVKIRHQMRVVPELVFYLDDTLDYIENIDKLLKK